LVGIAGWYAISMYGVIGAAVVVLIGQVVNLIIPTVWVVRKIRHHKNIQPPH